MADEKSITYGTAILFAILAVGISGTATYVLTQENIDKGYICSVDTRYQMGDSLSSTSKTLYWTVNGTKKQSTCINGMWIPITQYAKDNNIDINDLLSKPQDANDEDQSNAIDIVDEPVKENNINIFYEPTKEIKVWVTKESYANCLKDLTIHDCNDKLLLSQIKDTSIIIEEKLTKQQIAEIKADLEAVTEADLTAKIEAQQVLQVK